MLRNFKFLHIALAIFVALNLAILLLKTASANSELGNVQKIKYQPRKTLNRPVKKAKPKGNFDKKILNSPWASWGVKPNSNESINLMEAWSNFSKKRDVVVAVIDTGIDPSHPFLKDNLWTSTGKTASFRDFGIDFSKGSRLKKAPLDEHGHGTHVSGIIKSVHPKVKILSLKYYNPTASGQDNLDSTIAALRYAVDKNVDIINYSGGGPEPSTEELKILKEAERKGILVVAAAGNDENNIDKTYSAYYPASYRLSNIITVTTYDTTLNILSSSNYGKATVDISAPGYRIKSALPNKRAGFLTGTSQATAFVSGVAALLKSNYPKMTPKQMKEIINSSAKKIKGFDKYCLSGGRLDAGAAMKLAKKKNGKASPTIARSVAESKSSRNGKIIYRSNKQVAQ